MADVTVIIPASRDFTLETCLKHLKSSVGVKYRLIVVLGNENPMLRKLALEADAEIVVLGTAEGLEAKLVPDRGYELQVIERLPFPRRPNGYALRFPARYRRAVRRDELERAERVIAEHDAGG